jgi:hypothetical protein
MAHAIPVSRKKRGRGRPKIGAMLIGVRLPPDQLARIDAWANAQPDLPGRPEALRRLAALALGPPAAPAPKAGKKAAAAKP